MPLTFFPNDKLENALAAVITANATVAAISPAPSIVAGKNSGDRELATVICDCDGDGEEDPKGSGNFWIRAKISVKTLSVPNQDGTPDATTVKDADEALLAAVSGAIYRDDLPSLLNAAYGDLTVFPSAVIYESPKRSEDGNGAWINELGLRVYCCGSALT